MLTRVLALVREEIAREFEPPLRLEGLRHLPPRGLGLLFIGKSGDTRILIADLEPTHPTLHLATRSAAFDAASPAHFAGDLVGQICSSCREGEEPREVVLEFGELSLHLRYFGRGGAAVLTDRAGRELDRMPARRDPLAATDVRAGRKARAPFPAVEPVPREMGDLLRALVTPGGQLELPLAFDALFTAAQEESDDAVDAGRTTATGAEALEVVLIRAEALLRIRPELVDPAGSPVHARVVSDPRLYIFPSDAKLPAILGQELTVGALGFPPVTLTLSPLASLVGFERPLPAGSISRRLERAHELALQRASTEERRQRALQTARAEAQRLLRLRAHLIAERDAPNEGPKLRRFAEAILAHFAEVKRGDTRLVSEDWDHPEGPPLEIPLDPALGARENADAYFRRARRWERGEPHRTRRLALIDKAAMALSVLESKLATSDPPLREEAVVREITAALGALGIGPRTRKLRELSAPSGAAGTAAAAGAAASAGAAETSSRRRSPSRDAFAPSPRAQRPAVTARPREYKTREGWTVLVGRSNTENDQLSHKIAHPEDYWFHAHGVPGSHVVLRREGRKDNPSARTLEEAAAIAAFFSKARHASKAPVSYTLAKYVRKPRGGKPGLAVIQREKTILVAPRNPDEGRVPEWMEE